MGALITRESYREALAKAVELKGADFIYTKPEDAVMCRYMNGDDPDCIHAHALHALGVTQLHQYERTSIRVILHDLGVDDDILIEAAVRSQYVQDNGATWGKALEVFDSQISNPAPPHMW